MIEMTVTLEVEHANMFSVWNPANPIPINNEEMQALTHLAERVHEEQPQGVYVRDTSWGSDRVEVTVQVVGPEGLRTLATVLESVGLR